MITIRLDITKASNFAPVSWTLEEVVGERGKHWFFDICDGKDYGEGILSESEYWKNWNTMYLVDIKIRSHKKATLFALKWKE